MARFKGLKRPQGRFSILDSLFKTLIIQALVPLVVSGRASTQGKKRRRVFGTDHAEDFLSD